MRPRRHTLLALVCVGIATRVVLACGLDVVGTAPPGAEEDAATSGASLPPADAGASTPPPVDASSVQDSSACAPGECPCSEEAGTCAEAGTPVVLTVAVQGTAASGVVTGAGGVVSCPAACTASLLAGAQVTLTAKPALGETLVGWSLPACGRSLTCEVTVGSNLTVTARFAAQVHYTHTTNNLYRINGATGGSTFVAGFSQCGTSGPNDIAIDRAGKAVLVSDVNLFDLDLTNGDCNTIGAVGGNCEGLAFAPDPAAPDKDVLFAACGTSLYRLNRQTGARTLVGAFGGGWAIRGDLVWLPGQGLFASLENGGDDRIAKIDPLTGVASDLVDTGETGLRGLGWRGDALLAFGAGKVFSIDPATGNVTDLANLSYNALGGATGP